MIYYVVMFVSNTDDCYAGVLPILFNSFEDAQLALIAETNLEDNQTFTYSIEEVNTDVSLLD